MKKAKVASRTEKLALLVREVNTLVDDFHRVADVLGDSPSLETWRRWLVASLQSYGEEIAETAESCR